jgi:hypothetical protein
MLMHQKWAIVKIVFGTLMLVVKQCILNQSQDYLLLFDAFVLIFTLCITMKSEQAKIQSLNQPLI